MMCRFRVAFLAAATFCAMSSLPAQTPTFTEPTWPQQFTLMQGERVQYGFLTGLPGVIVVTVNASAQVAVALLKPDGTMAKNALGAGQIRLEYTATKEDIALGEGWRVGFAEPQPSIHNTAPPATPPPPAVSITLAVTHPAGDPRKLKVTAKIRPQGPPPINAQVDKELEAYRTAREAAASAASAQRLRTLQAKVNTNLAVIANNVVPQGRGTAASVVPPVTSTTKSAGTGTGSSGGGGTGGAPVGSNQPGTVAAAPVLTSRDTAGGRPGDPIFVSGSGFAPAAGLEAHFLVGANKDLQGTVTFYNDAQIVVQVPSIEGVPMFNGHFYLRRGTNNSRLIPFRFDPKMDYATLPMSSDRTITHAAFAEVRENFFVEHMHSGFDCKDDDEFFANIPLANGWVLDSAYVRQQHFGIRGPYVYGSPSAKGDAYVSVAALGTSSARIKVHYWCDENFWEQTPVVVRYWPVVVIRGPKGLPWH